jgi:hypothetical protein
MAPVEEMAPVAEMAPVEEAPVEELAPAAEAPVEEVAPAVEQPAPETKEMAKTPEAPKAKVESRYSTTITLGGGLLYAPTTGIGSYGAYAPQVTLGLNFNNVVTMSKNIGFGLEVAGSYDPMLNGSWSTFVSNIFSDFTATFDTLTQVGSVSVMPKIDLSLGKVDIALGGGGFFYYAPSETLLSEKYMYGAFAKMALSYNLNSWFSLGASGGYYWVLSEASSNPEIIKGSVFMGFSF